MEMSGKKIVTNQPKVLKDFYTQNVTFCPLQSYDIVLITVCYLLPVASIGLVLPRAVTHGVTLPSPESPIDLLGVLCTI